MMSNIGVTKCCLSEGSARCWSTSRPRRVGSSELMEEAVGGIGILPPQGSGIGSGLRHDAGPAQGQGLGVSCPTDHDAQRARSPVPDPGPVMPPMHMVVPDPQSLGRKYPDAYARTVMGASACRS